LLLLNFSHPLTAEQTAQLETLTGQGVRRVIAIPTQFDNGQPFLPQLQDLLAQVSLSTQEWQSEPMLVIPPSLNFITALLLAELHGRMGYFPAMVRIRPVAGVLPLKYEVAEIINFQEVRDAARKTRYF
jgi:hypothetical protein